MYRQRRLMRWCHASLAQMVSHPSGTFVIDEASLVVTTTAGSSAPVLVALTSAYPGFFTSNETGCGQAAALNIRPDGTVSINSPSNSAAPGDYVALFGTGFGLAVTQPTDGVAAAGPASLQSTPRLLLDGNPVTPSYAGLAPTLAGVDQINFQVPASTRNGCAVPISASQTVGSPTVTISVQNGGGHCSDPPVKSWRDAGLNKSSNPGVSNFIAPEETFGALFPSGPGMQAPALDSVVFAPN